MASAFVAAREAGKEQQHQHHGRECNQHQRERTPRSSCSSVSSAGVKGTSAAAPKCVRAPATHAGSFKCRLHRVNSHGRSWPL
ncbi:hypothetical protein MUK42_03500 [Musa troglodytarum]|uniref:Uncharacterized protein n=1 Tax=Musa troglodytarum TaxID=320322 RepID=A0A9E7KKE3_9LILI|nr:hypothetical protein MUK42_03500 [Musa troglodytarum]